MLSKEQKKELDELRAIYTKVYKAFTYVNEKIDRWDLRPSYWNGEKFSGNCGEFALACLQECKKARLLARMLVLQRPQGDWHGVCEVNGWILDNTQGDVRSRDHFKEYKFHAISGYTYKDPWHLIAG